MAKRVLGVIGGSGLYQMEGLERIEEVRVSTPFGDPSDALLRGHIGETELVFLPRHGRGHRYPPHRINYRANLLALKQVGVEQVISVSAVGSMKETIHPGDVVLVDQFIDRTRSRPSTFFEDDGVVAHVEFADPIEPALQEVLYRAAVELGARAHRGGTYVCIDGPQFSTRAESHLYRSWNVDVVGMTNLPEAKLAREAELPYATIALATDYDCWHESEAPVTVDAVLAVLQQNVKIAQAIIRHAATRLPDPEKSKASSALKNAILTQKDAITAEAKEKLSALIGKYVS